jgi:putative ABC transport system permease protein
VPHTVVGVMPPRFGWYGTDSFWRAASLLDLTIPANPLLRLKPGIAKETVEEQLQALFRRLAEENPARFPKDGFTVHLDNYLDVTVARHGMHTSLYLLLAAVGVLLLIACANVANLQFARGVGRAREFAVRAAVGASRVRLFRQLLTESVALAVAAGVIGVGLAYGMTRGIVVLLPPNFVPNEARVEMNGWVLAFAVVVSLLTGVVSGLLPCLQGSRPDLNRALKDGGPAAGDRQASRIHRGLVVASVAFSVVLLVAASLAGRSFAEIYRHDWGFRSDHLLLLRVPLPPERYATGEQRQQFAEALLARVQQLPGVDMAAFGTMPFVTGETTGFQLVGEPRVEGRRMGGSFVSPDFRATLGLRLLAGRDITAAEVARGEPVALISEAMAKLWPAGTNPLGRLIESEALGSKDTPAFRAAPNPTRFLTVVGIVNDTRNANFRADPPPAVYVPYTVRGLAMMQFLVRTRGRPLDLLPQVRTELRALDPSLPLQRPAAVEELMGQQTVLPRFHLALFGTLAGLALVLAAAGLYSLLAFSVAQRTHEIGVRMALGAERRDVIGLVVGSGGKLVGLGLVIGLGLSLAGTRLVQNKLFEVPAFDPAAFLAAAGVLVLAAATACLLPARRATKVDPVVALRGE